MRAFFGVFLAFFTLIALFLRPLSNYYEAKYQKDFFITDERAMALSDKFINAAEDGLQSAKSAIDKLTGIFLGDKKQVAASPKTEQNLTVSQAEPANLNAQNTQNLAPSISPIKEVNLTAQTAQISPAKTVSNLDKNGSIASNLTPSAPNKTNKSATFDIELNENLGVILIGDSIMQGFGWGFENALKTSKISIKNMAKASTGLTNKKFYDWSEYLTALHDENRYELSGERLYLFCERLGRSAQI